MTNRSLIFSKHLDSAPFKDFNVEVAVIQGKLHRKDLWLKREELFPIANYKKEESKFINGKLKGMYGVFCIIDDNTVELQNNSTVPIIIGKIKGHGLKRHMLLEIEYDYYTKEIVILNILDSSEVDKRLILKTSSNFKGFRDELIYYILLLPENYQDVAIQVLEPIWDSFKYTPGSVDGHHVFLGGLLEHTVENIRIAKTIMELNDYEQDRLLGQIYTLSASTYWDELSRKRRGETIETALNYMVNDFYTISDK